MKPEDYDKLTDEEKMRTITEDGARFAELVLQATGKWKHSQAVKCLGLLQASIAMCKMLQLVDQKAYEETVRLYWEKMQIAANTMENPNDNAA